MLTLLTVQYDNLKKKKTPMEMYFAYTFMQIKRTCMKTRFETEVQGNAEVAHLNVFVWPRSV